MTEFAGSFEGMNESCVVDIYLCGSLVDRLVEWPKATEVVATAGWRVERVRQRLPEKALRLPLAEYESRKRGRKLYIFTFS
jgi:hypothetical protein